MNRLKSTYRTLPEFPPILKWSIGVLVVVALLGDLISNEKPLYYKENGQQYFPVLHSYVIKSGLKKPRTGFLNTDWKNKSYESVLWPLIPYTYNTIDPDNLKKSPFASQNVTSWNQRHWLGTDQIGRDIAAGLINGLRVTLLIGIGTVFILALILSLIHI